MENIPERLTPLPRVLPLGEYTICTLPVQKCQQQHKYFALALTEECYASSALPSPASAPAASPSLPAAPPSLTTL